jgi:thiamine-phosphate pyrophosphorylase
VFPRHVNFRSYSILQFPLDGRRKFCSRNVLDFLRMQFCAITDRKCLTAPIGAQAVLERELRGLVAGWIQGGIDFIQIREKDLGLDGLCSLTNRILSGLDRDRSKVLVNLPPLPDWIRALAPIADGIHIPGRMQPGSVDLARGIFRQAGRSAIISASCHSLADVLSAKTQQVDFILFAPVFGKVLREEVLGQNSAAATTIPEESSRSTVAGTLINSSARAGGLSGQGLEALRAACRAAGEMPVFALGGVTIDNASACLAAGATGVAGIRLFAEGGWRHLARARSNI